MNTSSKIKEKTSEENKEKDMLGVIDRSDKLPDLRRKSNMSQDIKMIKEEKESQPSKIFIDDELENEIKPQKNHQVVLNLGKDHQINPDFSSTPRDLITRAKIRDHKVSRENRVDILEFLAYKVRPGAGNLTIGLKKLISLARVFLEEPSFIILEENAIDFDEFNNQFFLDVLRVRKMTKFVFAKYSF